MLLKWDHGCKQTCINRFSSYRYSPNEFGKVGFLCSNVWSVSYPPPPVLYKKGSAILFKWISIFFYIICSLATSLDVVSMPHTAIGVEIDKLSTP